MHAKLNNQQQLPTVHYDACNNMCVCQPFSPRVDVCNVSLTRHDACNEHACASEAAIITLCQPKVASEPNVAAHMQQAVCGSSASSSAYSLELSSPPPEQATAPSMCTKAPIAPSQPSSFNSNVIGSSPVISLCDVFSTGPITQEEIITQLLMDVDSLDPSTELPPEHQVLATINAITEPEDSYSVTHESPHIRAIPVSYSAHLSSSIEHENSAVNEVNSGHLCDSYSAHLSSGIEHDNKVANVDIVHLCNLNRHPNDERILITVDVQVEGHNVEALIDSGAEVSVVSSSIVPPTYTDVTTAADGWRLVAAAGQEIKVHSRLPLKLKLGQYHIEHPIFIADICRPLIIGIDLLKKMRATADFATGTVHWSEPFPSQTSCEASSAHDSVVKSIQTLTSEAVKANVPDASVVMIPPDGWSTDQVANPALKELIERFDKRELFAKNPKAPPRNTKVFHHIDVRGPPVRQPPRQRSSVAEEAFIESEVKMMLANGIVSASQSEWAANVVVVKKADGSNRFCVDSRPLNKVTVPDMYPFPRIDEILRSLGKSRIYSKLDMASSYWQIPIVVDDRHKTSFVCKLGQFQFNVLSFGLRNAPATFQRAIETALREAGLLWTIAIAYIDDIIIFSKTFEEHLKHTELVFECVVKAGFALKRSKCLFAATRIAFLGHIVSSLGIGPDPEKVRAISAYPCPQSVDDVRAFVGLAGFYRDHIKGFAKIANPLTNMLRQGIHFGWTEAHEDAFSTLKRHLVSAPILTFPDFDKPFTITTDFCSAGVGAVLGQTQGVIEYASRSLTPVEQHYFSSEGECFAVIWAVDRFRYYVEGRHFILETDNAAVSWLLNKQFIKLTGANGRLARWAYSLMGFDFEVKPRRGRDNGAADGLSRGAISEANPLVISTDEDADVPRTAEVNAFRTGPGYDNTRLLHRYARDGPPEDEHSNGTNGSNDNPAMDIMERLKIAYRTDPFYNAIIQYSGTGMLPEDAELAARVLSEFPYYEVVGDMVLRVMGKDADTLVSVPESMTTKVIQHVHESAAHLGVEKTYKTLRTRFFWNHMVSDVSSVIAACSICQKAKQPTTNSYAAPLTPLPMVTDPNGRIAIDIIKFTCTNPREYIGAAVITDYLTRRASIYPVTGEDAEHIAPVLMKYISIYGAPIQLLSDRGKVFLGEIIKHLCKIFSITKVNTTSYHPQCDGLVERFNRTLIAMLTAYVDSNQGDWDRYLPLVEFAYNTSVHPSISISPFEATFGFPPVMPYEAAVANITSDRGWGVVMPLYISELRSKLEAIWALSHQHLHTAQLAQKDAYDCRHITLTYQVGDLVLLNVAETPVEKGDCKKLRFRYQGPYRVTEVHATNIALVRLEPADDGVNPGLAESYVNIARLRPFKTLAMRVAHADAGVPIQSEDPTQTRPAAGPAPPTDES